MSRVNERTIDLETVTVTFDEETIEALDEKAFVDHRDNREAAIRDCLDEWLKQQADDETD